MAASVSERHFRDTARVEAASPFGRLVSRFPSVRVDEAIRMMGHGKAGTCIDIGCHRNGHG